MSIQQDDKNSIAQEPEKKAIGRPRKYATKEESKKAQHEHQLAYDRTVRIPDISKKREFIRTFLKVLRKKIRPIYVQFKKYDEKGLTDVIDSMLIDSRPENSYQ